MTVKFIKDKETKTKVRYAITNVAGNFADAAAITGSIYIEKDSELAKESEIIMEIAQVTS